METILLYTALVLGVFNALLPLAKKIAAKTKNTTDDKAVEMLESALSIAKALQKKKVSDDTKKN
ncbi:MAG: hypothetical protein Unbinned4336contig1001_43 [Prokaryotic dsDNA virus sp.]|nr:MAG: hypothetical protein Unbinned4336contig1001_43 [Prokaryotic dsDNA virus sp.]|tara:strand:- start:1297 stop:1488 length:192 start_codon:yes stop_codon:yes gene_type:complete